jgi:hypothetical protein
MSNLVAHFLAARSFLDRPDEPCSRSRNSDFSQRFEFELGCVGKPPATRRGLASVAFGQPRQRILFSWNHQGGLRWCRKSAHCRKFKEMNFHFAHQVEPMCRDGAPGESARWQRRATSGPSLAGLVLARTRFARAGHRIAAAALILLAVVELSPLGNALIEPLEDHFPPWDATRGSPAGIVVLGGAVDPGFVAARNEADINEAAERIAVVPALASCDG